MRRFALGGLLATALFALPVRLLAGGSGLNTVVVINQSSSNSCEAANYFCERRQVPPENVLRINWLGGNVAWTNTDFQTYLLTPLQAMLATRQLTNQIDYVVLSMDIPFQTYNGMDINSTTAALFYGLKNSLGLTNSYFASEQSFSQARPASAPGYAFLTTMLTANSSAEAKQLVDQGVNSDGTFPAQTVLLEKSSDTARNLRYQAFDHALFNSRLCPGYSVVRTNTDAPWAVTNLLGLETGLSSFYSYPGIFIPGAIADSMTSYAGLIFGGSGGQTTELAWISAGAAGSYGTVTEPGNSIDKFPTPMVYFYQARGFSLAECYYQSLNTPYQGLIVAEPLAAPFARPGFGSWVGTSSNAVLSGTAQLSVRFTAATPTQPLQAVDLFVDGKYFSTLTNIAPLAGNLLSLKLNAAPVSYTVSAAATLSSIASGLTAQINNPATTNVSRTTALAFGDRIELHSISAGRLPPPGVPRIQGSSTNTGTIQPPSFVTSSNGTASSLTTFLTASRNVSLDSPTRPLKVCSASGTLQVGGWIQLSIRKINGTVVNVAATNQDLSGNPYTLAGQLFTNLNNTASLQGSDGVSAEDYTQSLFGGGQFNLFARTPGLAAAGIQITFGGSASMIYTPSATSTLNDNISDVQPRNHVYVRAGVTNLTVNFPLPTTAIADGYHDLTAVAYEGSSVRTQTRTTLPVRVQNSSLSATMALLDLGATNSVLGIYHIQVAANTNNATAISLFSTGGMFATATNQSSAIFTVNGPALGVGLHQFYSLVQTASGQTYRTQPQWVRLVAGP